MAWSITKSTIQMAEDDYGIELPIRLKGIPLNSDDSVRIIIKSEKNGEALLVKDLPIVSGNVVKLVLPESDSVRLPVGSYVYSLDWYKEGKFRCNIIPSATFKVVDKA